MINFLKSLNFLSPAWIFEKTSDRNANKASMTTPFLDFLMVGGISVFFLPFIFVTNQDVIKIFAMVVIAFTFIINNPHFIHSYQLLYDNFFQKLNRKETSIQNRIRFWVSGIIVPTILMVVLLIAVIQPNKDLLGFCANVMFFLVGWHYIKQGYGVLITMSVRHKVFYEEWEKKVFLYNGYLCWISFWATHNSLMNREMLFGLPYWGMNVPSVLGDIFLLLSAISTIVFFIVIYRKFEKTKQFCFNGFVGYVSALYFWLFISSFHVIFIYVVPALHSLQYLLFVWKMKYEKGKEEIKLNKVVESSLSKDALKYMRQFFVTAVVVGALSFYIIPKLLEIFLPYDHENFGAPLFLYTFAIFINVHHYFIDFAIWRKDNPDMKYLFR